MMRSATGSWSTVTPAASAFSVIRARCASRLVWATDEQRLQSV